MSIVLNKYTFCSPKNPNCLKGSVAGFKTVDSNSLIRSPSGPAFPARSLQPRAGESSVPTPAAPASNCLLGIDRGRLDRRGPASRQTLLGQLKCPGRMEHPTPAKSCRWLWSEAGRGRNRCGYGVLAFFYTKLLSIKSCTRCNKQNAPLKNHIIRKFRI